MQKQIPFAIFLYSLWSDILLIMLFKKFFNTYLAIKLGTIVFVRGWGLVQLWLCDKQFYLLNYSFWPLEHTKLKVFAIFVRWGLNSIVKLLFYTVWHFPIKSAVPLWGIITIFITIFIIYLLRFKLVIRTTRAPSRFTINQNKLASIQHRNWKTRHASP